MLETTNWAQFFRLYFLNLKKYYLGLKNKDEKIEPNWLFLAFKKTEKSGFLKKSQNLRDLAV